MGELYSTLKNLLVSVSDAMGRRRNRRSLVELDLNLDMPRAGWIGCMTDRLHARDAVLCRLTAPASCTGTEAGGAIAKDAAVDHKRLIDVLLEEDLLRHA